MVKWGKALVVDVAAGRDSFQGEDYYPTNTYDTNNEKSDVAFKISGDSMEPEISDGDIVLVKSSEVVDEGKLAVVYYDGNYLCKILKHSGESLVLHSLNEKYSDIEVLPDAKLKVYGEVIQIDSNPIS